MFNVLGITIEPDSKLIPADTKNSGFDVIGLSKSPKIRVEIHNEKNVVYTLANGNIIRDPQTRAVIEFSYGEIESAAYLFPPGTDFITLTAYGFRNSQREVIKICIVE